MRGSEALQLFVLGIISGSTIGLLAASFGLILTVTQRFHVAYMSSYVLGAYGAIWVQQSYGLPIGAAVVIGLAVATLLGLVVEALVYRPISAYSMSRGANPLIPIFMASLGISIVVSNLLSLHFNTSPIPFNILKISRPDLGSVHITNWDIVETIVAWVVVLALAAFLRFTKRGRWIAAVRSNQDLAATVGIKVRRIFLLVFAIGSGIAGLLGLMEATANAATPAMGFDQVFYGFVVAFLAGMTSGPIRMAVVGLIIGELDSMSGLFFNTEWSSLIVFGILFAYVIYQSIVGRWAGVVRRMFTARSLERA